MSKNLEIEYKTLLSKEDFCRIADYFQFKEDDFFVQTNTYFDTSDFLLKQKRAGLRIRSLPDAAEITLKVPDEVGKLEITDDISLEQAKQLLLDFELPENSEVRQKLSEMAVTAPLHVIGELKTKRAQKKLPQGLLALDESWYNNTHDFELELEVEDAYEGKKAFKELLNSLSLKKTKGPNKIQRMLLTSPLYQSEKNN